MDDAAIVTLGICSWTRWTGGGYARLEMRSRIRARRTAEGYGLLIECEAQGYLCPPEMPRDQARRTPMGAHRLTWDFEDSDRARRELELGVDPLESLWRRDPSCAARLAAEFPELASAYEAQALRNESPEAADCPGTLRL